MVVAVIVTLLMQNSQFANSLIHFQGEI